MLDFILYFYRYGNIVQNSIGHYGDIQEQGASNDIKNTIPSDNNVVGDYKVSKHSNITPPSNAPANSWTYANNKSNIEPPTRSSYNGDYLQMIQDKTTQNSSFQLQSQLEAHSVPQNVAHGYTEQPTMPSKSNKESPPPYSQALLNHHNAGSQQMNVGTSSINNGLVKNGVLQRQVQAASDVVQTLSQLNSPPVPSISHTKPTRLSYGVTHSSSLPQTTNATLPHGDYHIASFTKPIPTSSYITSLSSDAAAAAGPSFQLPQSSLSRNPPSPPLQSLPSTIPYSPNLSSMSSIVDQSNSFTNTFLRGILTSIDSKDPVVANAWLETLLDAIDLLPADVK